MRRAIFAGAMLVGAGMLMGSGSTPGVRLVPLEPGAWVVRADPTPEECAALWEEYWEKVAAGEAATLPGCTP